MSLAQKFQKVWPRPGRTSLCCYILENHTLVQVFYGNSEDALNLIERMACFLVPLLVAMSIAITWNESPGSLLLNGGQVGLVCVCVCVCEFGCGGVHTHSNDVNERNGLSLPPTHPPTH